MKINKLDPVHWMRLATFASCVMAGILIRPFRKKCVRRRIIFYGHRLSGNLLSLFTHLREKEIDEFDVVFLTMDNSYLGRLAVSGAPVVSASSAKAIDWISTASAIITD